MKSLSEHLREQAARTRSEAGLPVIVCENCGEVVARGTGHYIPDSLDEYGLIVPGHYTCERAS
jgi:hypothetical protein